MNVYSKIYNHIYTEVIKVVDILVLLKLYFEAYV